MKGLKLFFEAIRDLLLLTLPIGELKKNKTTEFVFLANPRDSRDVYNKYHFLKIFNDKWLEKILSYMWPVKISSVEGLKNLQGKLVHGWIFGIPPTADHILRNKDNAVKRIIQAIKLAESYGVSVVGLGGYTSSIFKNYNEYKTPLIITSGNSFTTIVSMESIKKILEENNKSIEDVNIAIIGATGSIGKMISSLLLENGAKNIFLLARNAERLENLKNSMKRIFPNKNISIVGREALNKSDIVVTVTNSPTSLLTPNDLKKNAIVYDISQPKNVPQNTLNKREDCKFYEGGLVIPPPNINLHYNFRLRENTIFACFAETMIIAAANFKKELVKEGSPDYISQLQKVGFELGFKPYYYQLRGDHAA